MADTPTGIDPFTYCAPNRVQAFKCTYTTTSVGAQLSVKTLMAAEPLNPKSDQASGNDSTVAPEAASTTPARATATASTPTDPSTAARRAPKVLFPDSHLAELLQLVEGNTRIQTDIVSQLKAHFEGVASKAAIELKLKEVASRQGKSKESAWRVTPEAWACRFFTMCNHVKATVLADCSRCSTDGRVELMCVGRCRIGPSFPGPCCPYGKRPVDRRPDFCKRCCPGNQRRCLYLSDLS